MESEASAHQLNNAEEKNLDGLIQVWAADVLENWTERWGEKANRGYFRTALVAICRVREAHAAAEEAAARNAIYHNPPEEHAG